MSGRPSTLPVERSLAVRAGNERVGDQGGEAGEDEQSPRQPKLVGGDTVQSEMPGAQQKAQDGQADRGSDQRRDPNRDAMPQAQGEHVIGFPSGSWVVRLPVGARYSATRVDLG
jgi:hypothetical protein